MADLATPDAVRATRRQTYDVGPQGVIFLVADGMGGAAAGEVASDMAAESIHRYLVDVWRTDSEFTPERFAERLRAAVELANVEIHNYAREHPELRGMGTTATLAGVWRDRLYLAQIGDSRAYLVRNGEARQLTRDQSLTQRLVEVGELTEEEAEASERRNIILQALGPDALVKVDLSWQSLQQGDIMVICSDGLSTVVRRDDISQVVTGSDDIEKICEQLVNMANDRGGPDNITVIVAQFEGDGLPAALPEPPGYHEVPTASRPALQSTLAMPAVPTRPPAATTVGTLPSRRMGAPSGRVLFWLAVLMGILALGLYFAT